MKLLLPALLVSLNSFCQINSDDLGSNIVKKESNTTENSKSLFRPSANNVSLCDSGSIEIYSNSCFPSSFWYR